MQGRIQDLIRGGGPDRDRPKTAILGPQFCRILVLGPHFWWSGGGLGPRGPPPGSAPDYGTVKTRIWLSDFPERRHREIQLKHRVITPKFDYFQ